MVILSHKIAEKGKRSQTKRKADKDIGKISVEPNTFFMHTVLCLTKQ